MKRFLCTLSMVQLRSLFICICLFFISNNAVVAVEVKDLYLARVEVTSQSISDRNRAFRQALDTVLVKVSGKQEILQHPIIKRNRAQYKNYVSHFRYEKRQSTSHLVVNFDAAKINQLFVNANLPMWGSLRPQVVVWLVEENGLSRAALSANDNSENIDTVEQVHLNRGLPLVVPLMDLQDITHISATDLWGRFSQTINSASMRYHPEAIVVVRISNNSLLSEQQMISAENCLEKCTENYALDWSFLSMENTDNVPQISERYYGKEPKALLEKALTDLADMVAARYMLTTEVKEQYIIDVANVDSLSKYVQIKKFLKELSAVRDVKLIQAVGDRRRFSLSLFGSEQTLLASLKLNQSLTRYFDPLDPSSLQGIPLFYWESP